MKRNQLKWILGILAVALVFALLPGTAFAASTITIYPSQFVPDNMVLSPDGNYLYATASSTTVYRENLSDGSITPLSVPYTAKKLYVSDGIILATLQKPDSNQDAIAVIDPDTFTLTGTVDTDIDLNGATADANYIYAYSNYKINVYARVDFSKLSTYNTNSVRCLQVNPVSGKLYAAGYDDTISFTVADGKLTQAAKSTYYAYSNFAIMPDGMHLMLDSGAVLDCSDDASKDLVLDKNYSVSNELICTDAAANKTYAVAQRLITVYDAADLSCQRVIGERATPDYLLCGGGRLVIGNKQSNGSVSLRIINSGAMLKNITLNGDAFTEFYPAEITVDRGEVSYATDKVDIEAVPAEPGATVSGDTGEQALAVGENTFTLTVTDPITEETETYTQKVTRRASDPAVDAIDARVKLPFTPLDVVMDPSGNYEYMTAKDGYSLYRVNIKTGAVEEKKFDLKAERLTLKNGKIYVTLLRYKHSSYNFDLINGYGAFAVVDVATFKTERIFNTNIDPYDIAVDAKGTVYLAPGSNQWSIMASYDGSNGRNISNGFARQESFIDLNEVNNKIYSIDTDSSPQDIEVYGLADGVITGSYDSPYHGDYRMGAPMRVSPDGKYIFTASGNIFTCASGRTDDMQYDGTTGLPYDTICFDLEHNAFYTAKDKTITCYNYDTRTVRYSKTSDDDFIDIQNNNGSIAAMLKKSNGDCYLSVFTMQGLDASLSGIRISEGTLSPAFDKDITDYSLVLDQNTASVLITPALSDSGATVKIDGDTASSKNITLAKCAAVIIKLEVTSKNGNAVKAYTIRAYRESGGKSFTRNDSYFLLKQCKTLDGSNIMALSGKEQPYLYGFNGKNGKITALRLPYTVVGIGTANDAYLVGMYQKEFNRYYIGVIDPDTFTVSKVFVADSRITGLTGDAQYIYTYRNEDSYWDSGITVYSRTDCQKKSSLYMDINDMAVNPKNGLVYVACPYSIQSYKPSDGNLVLVKTNNTCSENSIVFMPDSQNMSVGANIFSCSTDPSNDLVNKAGFSTSTIAANRNTNELYAVRERNIEVYDATSFAFLRMMYQQQNISGIWSGGSDLFTANNISSGSTVYRSVTAGALLKSLKINGEPFSGFYPTVFAFDRGEVPNTTSSINIEATAATDGAVVSGDTGSHALAVGKNVFSITVKDPKSSDAETYTVTITRRASDPAVQTADARVKLPFTPLDIAADPSGTYEYMTAVNGYSLYRVNINTGVVEEKKFDIKAERLAVKNGKIYVTLLRYPHNSGYYDLINGYGAVAVVDAVTFTTENIFNTNIDPYDIAADTKGNVYLAPGSNQWSIMASYDSSNGRNISSNNFARQESFIEFNDTYNKFYSIDTDSSPQDIEAYQTAEGVIKGNYDSPYHGDYSMGTPMRLSPDGKFIFTSSGNIFTCAATSSGDMVYNGKLGKSYNTICFNMDDKTVLTANGKTLTAYDYVTRNEKLSAASTDDITDLQYMGSRILAVQKKANGDYYTSILDASHLLGSITVNGTAATDFASLSQQYAVTIPTDSDTVNLGASAVSAGDSVAGALGVQPLKPGLNTYTLTVSGTDGKSKIYTLSITRIPPGNANLSGISTSVGKLSPAFNAAATNYTMDIGENNSSVTISPVTSDTKATRTILVDGVLTTSNTITLNSGAERIVTIQVTASDGVTKKVYTIDITRGISLNTNLSNISATVGTLSPAFSTNVFDYCLSIDTDSTVIKAVKYFSSSAVKIDGAATDSETVTLANGETKDVSIQVIAKDGTQKTYVVHVLRLGTANAYLSAINLTGAKLSSPFCAIPKDSGNNYTASVSSLVPNVTIAVSKAVAGASVEINGYAASNLTFSLDTGETKNINIEVTAQDGKTVKDYTVSFTREFSNNANLSAISASAGSMSPAFKNTVSAYTVTLPSSVNMSVINVSAEDTHAAVKIDGSAVLSKTIYLEAGGTQNVSVAVTAQDGKTQKIYTVCVKRNLYKVTFDSRKGSNVEPALAAMNNNITRPANPVREGYEFKGWYLTTEYNALWNFDEDTVTQDMTLYAKWAVKAYTVIFNTGVGSNVSNQTIAYQGKAIEPSEPTLAGHVFAGWYADAACQKLWDFDEDSITSNTTLYAKWISEGNATISLVSEPSEGGTVSGGKVYANGETAKIKAIPNRYYRFVEWKSGNQTVSTDAVYAFTVIGNSTLTAVFEKIPVPTLTTADTSSNSVKLSWTPVAGAEGYNIYSATKKDGNYTKISSVSGTTYTDTSVKPGTTYYYKVAAFDQCDTATTTGMQSGAKQAVTIPGTPGSFKITKSGSSAKLSWGKVSGVSGYEVYRSGKSSSGFKTIKSTSQTSYTNSGLKKGSTYYYCVRAYKVVNGKNIYSKYTSVIKIKF